MEEYKFNPHDFYVTINHYQFMNLTYDGKVEAIEIDGYTEESGITRFYITFNRCDVVYHACYETAHSGEIMIAKNWFYATRNLNRQEGLI